MDTFAEGEASLWSAQFAALLSGVFGAVALLLAVLGVYAVKSHAVVRRTREIGIRAALGARPADLVAMILRETAAQIAVAALAGVVLALLAGRALSVLIYHVSPADPLALGGAVFVLAATALAASLPPARRAVRVDPMLVLRTE
jgi:ABC-type antimicrobial peptide transport system permease subunit